MYCSNCGAHVPDDAAFCPSCGAQTADVMQQNAPVSRKKNTMFIATVLIVAVALVISVFSLTHFLNGYQDEREQAQLLAQQAEEAQKMSDEKAGEKDDKEDKTPTTVVTNQYYYYGDHASEKNDYYTETDAWSYLWPTDSQYISTADLRGMSQDTVAALRNEIYARHGYAFATEYWQNYFVAKAWYRRDSTCDDSSVRGRLSSIERANISTIVSYEEGRGWR